MILRIHPFIPSDPHIYIVVLSYTSLCLIYIVVLSYTSLYLIYMVMLSYYPTPPYAIIRWLIRGSPPVAAAAAPLPQPPAATPTTIPNEWNLGIIHVQVGKQICSFHSWQLYIQNWPIPPQHTSELSQEFRTKSWSHVILHVSFLSLSCTVYIPLHFTRGMKVFKH